MIKLKVENIDSQKLEKELNKIIEHTNEKKREKITPVALIKPVELEKSSKHSELLYIVYVALFKKLTKFLLGKEVSYYEFLHYLPMLKTKEGYKKILKKIYHKVKHIPVIGFFARYTKAVLTLHKIDDKIDSVTNITLTVNHELFLTKNHITNLEKELKLTKNHITTIDEKLNYVHILLKEDNIPQTIEEDINYPVDKKLPFYIAFEQLFRGEEYTVKDRLNFYLKYINKSLAVLDLGTGRGEFLFSNSLTKFSSISIPFTFILFSVSSSKNSPLPVPKSKTARDLFMYFK